MLHPLVVLAAPVTFRSTTVRLRSILVVLGGFPVRFSRHLWTPNGEISPLLVGWSNVPVCCPDRVPGRPSYVYGYVYGEPVFSSI